MGRASLPPFTTEESKFCCDHHDLKKEKSFCWLKLWGWKWHNVYSICLDVLHMNWAYVKKIIIYILHHVAIKRTRKTMKIALTVSFSPTNTKKKTMKHTNKCTYKNRQTGLLKSRSKMLKEKGKEWIEVFCHTGFTFLSIFQLNYYL